MQRNRDETQSGSAPEGPPPPAVEGETLQLNARLLSTIDASSERLEDKIDSIAIGLSLTCEYSKKLNTRVTLLEESLQTITAAVANMERPWKDMETEN